MNEWIRLGVGLVVLASIAIAALTAAGVAQRRMVVWASVRAIAQLTIVAAALRGVFAAPSVVVVLIAVMFSVATWTAARRLNAMPHARIAVVTSCGAGAAITIALIVAVPILDRTLRDLVAVSGIVIGGTMTAATLTGRRLLDGLHRRRDEIEAWLSVGPPHVRQSGRSLGRRSSRHSYRRSIRPERSAS